MFLDANYDHHHLASRCRVFTRRGRFISDNASAHGSIDDDSAVTASVIKPARKPLQQQIVEQPAAIEPFEITPVHAKVSGYVERMVVELGQRVQDQSSTKTVSSPSRASCWLKSRSPSWSPNCSRSVRRSNKRAPKSIRPRLACRSPRQRRSRLRRASPRPRAAIRKADALVAKTAAELTRIKELNERNAIATKLVDEMQQSAAVAGAERDAAAAQYETAQAAIGEAAALVNQARADLTAFAARVKVAEAGVQEVQVKLDYATLHAPFTGVVTRRNAHTGHLVTSGAAGEPLMVLARLIRSGSISTFPRHRLLASASAMPSRSGFRPQASSPWRSR